MNPLQMKAVSKDLLNAVLEHPGLRSVRVQCMDEQRRFGRRKVSATFAFTSMGRFGRSNICKHQWGDLAEVTFANIMGERWKMEGISNIIGERWKADVLACPMSIE